MLHSHAHSFSIIYGCFVLQGQSTELQETQYGPRRLKYLLPGPFERSFADPCSHPSALFSAAEYPLHFPALMPLFMPLFIVLLTTSKCQNTAYVLRLNSDV